MSKEAEANCDDPVQIDSQTVGENKVPSCCICMDVRIGTVMIGLFNLICHAIWIVSLTRYFIHHRETKQWEIIDNLQEHIHEHQEHANHQMVALIVACMSFLVVVLLIFGAVLRRSCYVLPFFCVQVFDICLTVLIAATVMNYAPQLKLHLELNDNVHSECFRKMSLSHFRMLLFTFWILILLIKYYFASVVWDCYKHCKQREDRNRMLTPPTILLYGGDMETMNLLPTYDDVIKTNPPPAYQ